MGWGGSSGVNTIPCIQLQYVYTRREAVLIDGASDLVYRNDTCTREEVL